MVLITGGSGKLGRELKKVFPNALSPSHIEMDITNLESVNDYFIKNKNDIGVVIHTAAMTDVRKCEENKEETILVNVQGTRYIVNAAKTIGAKVIYISTACVFNGETAPFDEFDLPTPKNWYSYTKYLAEYFVVSVSDKNLVIRTNFVAFEPWPYPYAFTDRYGTYLFAHDVAAAIKQVINMSGIVHVCGKDTLSMYNLAKIVSPDVKPMTMKDYYNGPTLTRDMRLISKRIPPFEITPGIL